MSVAAALVDKNFGTSGGELLVGGLPVSGLAEEYGTPLFVYDLGIPERKLAELRAVLPDRLQIYYSVKANPNRALLKTFLAQGCGLEIASGGELAQALAAGCEPENVLFAGPGKSEAETRAFLAAGGGELHVESQYEAVRLGALADELAVDVRAAVRINPTADAQGGAMRMGGKPGPFGVDEESMGEVIEALESAPRVHLTGVHIFAGTQILDAEVLGSQYRKCLELARTVSKATGRPIETVDFGGGLGIPYFKNEAELDVARYGEVVTELLEEAEPSIFETTRFLIEPGRYLVGDCGVYVARVLDVKTSRGKRFVVIDGGMHHHLAASGNLGQVIKKNFPIVAASRMNAESASPAEVVGPLCTPLDTLGRGLDLPELEPGDLVAVLQSGGYARAASPLGFLSHPTPPEVVVGHGAARLARRRGSYEAMMGDLV